MVIAFQPTLRLYGRSPLWGLALPLIAAVYLGFTLDSAYQHSAGRGGLWKGPRAGRNGKAMTVDTKYKSGKSEHDENFPVASRFVAPRFARRFWRSIALPAPPTMQPIIRPRRNIETRNSRALEDTLLGRSDAAADALPLRAELRARNLTPQHALDLLKAFRQDVPKSRYEPGPNSSSTAAIRRCRSGASFSTCTARRVDVGAVGCLCTALQIINHLQDCGKDYRDLDRVYVPLDDLGASTGRSCGSCAVQASPQFLGCLHRLPVALPGCFLKRRCFLATSRTCVSASKPR